MKYTKIPDLPIEVGNISEIACGDGHTLILAKDKQIYAGGVNGNG